ncbi:hypothetical protein KX816_07370 [Sphingosinicellaceae bacterium]|nr:hypothetical protein KX816_07370 [Sphingosinicellaceae bacterium]
MVGAIVPDDFDHGLVTEPMDVEVVGNEVVVNSGNSTLVLDASSALESGRRLIQAAAQIRRS